MTATEAQPNIPQIAGSLSKAADDSVDASRRAGFRWEDRCLSDDPFAGDFGTGEIALSDKMVTNRNGGICHTCASKCEPGTRNRVLVERGELGLETYRWCQACCFAMAVYDIRPSIGDRQFQLGQQRRQNAAYQTPSTGKSQ